jgi:hypothetical protein
MIPDAKKASVSRALQASHSRDSLEYALKRKKRDLTRRVTKTPPPGLRRALRKGKRIPSGWDRNPSAQGYEVTMVGMTVLDCWLFF